MGAIPLSESQMIFHPLLIDKLVQVLNLFCPICKKMKYRRYLEKKDIKDEEEQDKDIAKFRANSPMYKFIGVISELVKEQECCDMKVTFKHCEETNTIKKHSALKKESEHADEDMKPKDVLKILNLLSKKDLELIGLKNAHPANMVM